MKPILFNTEMVRAILEGRKTVTRRVINRDIADWCDKESDGTLLNYENSYGDFINPVDLCRYRVGDVLYVRETWNKVTNGYIYKATNEPVMVNGYKISLRWRPSIHMPKAAARIFLRVTSVRVERLQDMKFKDYKAEGINNPCDSCNAFPFEKCNTCSNDATMALSFIALWDSTIKHDQLKYYGWKANPYVWVIEFERVEKPEAV